VHVPLNLPMFGLFFGFFSFMNSGLVFVWFGFVVCKVLYHKVLYVF
jgi:hypothetical protein